jgi:hypothetical protein
MLKKIFSMKAVTKELQTSFEQNLTAMITLCEL